MRISTTIHAQTLYVVPKDPTKLPDAIARARRNLQRARQICETGQDVHGPGILGRELSRLGELLGLAEQHTEACELCEEALAVWKKQNRTNALLMTTLKFVSVLERARCYRQAHQRLTQVLEHPHTPSQQLYRDFALYQRGVLLWREGHIEEATHALQESLRIRNKRGVERLIHQTQHALCRIQESPCSPSSTEEH